MITQGRDFVTPMVGITQRSRAVGIHLVIATQRPSTDIITGIIKAHFPARIAFKVSSEIDSKTIIDTTGAEQLLGMGDMLFTNSGSITRIQGCFVDNKEIESVCDWIAKESPKDTSFVSANQNNKTPFGFQRLMNLLKFGKKKDHNDKMEIMSFEDMLASLDINAEPYKFPCEEYDIIGDTTEIDKILNASGIINIGIAEITETLSKDKVNYISVGYGEGDSAAYGAIKEAVDNLPLGIDEIAKLLIHIWMPPGGMGQPIIEVSNVINFIETLPSDLDAFFGIARGELPDVSSLKKQKVKVSLIAVSK